MISVDSSSSTQRDNNKQSFTQKTHRGKKKLLFTLPSAAFDNVGKQFVFISCVVVEQTGGLGRMQ